MRQTTASTDTLPALISGCARNFPESIALRNGDLTLSYAELNAKAQQFAGYLTQLGVAGGESVALCMERSFDWIVSALGIMKAGAAYVPLDSAWPDSRIRFAISDSGAKAVVGRSGRLEQLQVDTFGVDPKRDAGLIANSSGTACELIRPESLAYIVYTSGSTGSPKGVEITHANLSHLARWHRQAFGITREDRVSHLASLGFDAAVWDIWPNLGAGATLCLAADTVRFSADSVQRWMLQERVTVGFVPTVYAMPMMAMKWPSTTALRFLLTGGDTLRVSPHEPLPFKVVNNYGPAECTVVGTSHVLDEETEEMPPIGIAISGATVYILDEDRRQVADGTIGEIYIGGNGVGRGYHNLPAMTMNAFMPDPFALSAGARMYRTGDRGFRRPSGEIEFRGRLDRQIKIRGQRVELDEIGNTLAVCPGIEFGVAIAHPSPDGTNQVIAYFLPKDNSVVPTANELRIFLRSILPEYMVPSAFVQLASLPVSTNGKIDLARLPKPAAEFQSTTPGAQNDDSEVRSKLLGIVQELLNGQSIAVEDNLFLSGGHSLFGMQLLTRVRGAFGVDLTLQQLFESPTVEALARLIEVQPQGDGLCRTEGESNGCIPAHANNSVGQPVYETRAPSAPNLVTGSCLATSWPVSKFSSDATLQRQLDAQNGHLKGELEHCSGVLALHPNGTRQRIFWMHNLPISLAKELGDDQPFFIFTLTLADLSSLGEKPNLQEIAACLVKKVLALQPQGPYILGGLCIASVLTFEIAQQMKVAGYEVRLLVVLDAPTQPYLKSCTSMTTKLRHPAYAMQRVVRIGVRKTAVNVGKRLLKYIPFSIRYKFSKGDWDTTHEMIENAAFQYHHQAYDGDVLLLLSSHQTAHLDFLPGWESVVRGNLRTAFVDGHHRDFITPHNVSAIAEIIGKELPPAVEERPAFAALTPSA